MIKKIPFTHLLNHDCAINSIAISFHQLYRDVMN